MIRIPLKAGGALLLVLALAPSLHAGGKPSRTTLVLAGAAMAAAAVADPGSTAALAAAAPATATVALPFASHGPSKRMSFLCPGPYLKPASGSDLQAVDKLVEEAVQGYREGGCDPAIAEKVLCIGPDAWVPPAGARKMSAGDYIRARYAALPSKHAEDRDGNQGEVTSWATVLEKVICKSLSDFQRDASKDRHAALFQRLLEAGDLHERLQETHQRARELNQAARKNQSAVEKAMCAKKNLALAKELAAYKGGRLPQVQQARQEGRRAQAALDDAQYEVDVTANTLAQCDRAMGRFDRHIEPILSAMSPGRLNFPELPPTGNPIASSTTDPDED
jgi:hypothetical protein